MEKQLWSSGRMRWKDGSRTLWWRSWWQWLTRTWRHYATHRPVTQYYNDTHTHTSDVTRVGVTQSVVSPGAATDGVSPISLSKNGDLFLVITTKWWHVLAVDSSQLHNSHLPTSCCSVFFVNFQPQFLANVNSSSCSLYVVVRPSVVCLSSVCL